MAEDAVGEVVVADEPAGRIVMPDELGHVPDERGAAGLRRERGGCVAEIPPRGLVPPGPEAREPRRAGAVLAMGVKVLCMDGLVKGAPQESSRSASATRASRMSGRRRISAPRVRSTRPSWAITVNSRVTCSRRQPMRAASTWW